MIYNITMFANASQHKIEALDDVERAFIHVSARDVVSLRTPVLASGDWQH